MKNILAISLLKKTVAVAAIGALCGCAAFNYTEPDAPVALSSIARLDPSPRIAVVFGSGGPRGYAHIGVISQLEANGIKPDLIVGTSVGALIGAFWASGLPAAQIEEKALAGGPLTLFDLSPFADRGWIHGQRLQDYVNTQLGSSALGGLPTRMIVVATRRDDKAARFFTQGNAGVAVRASSAVPKVFSPVGIAGVEYEDGDVSLPLAVQAARDAGARFVIAVDVSAHEGSAPAGTPAEWLATDAKRRARIAPQLPAADFLIHPDLGYTASPKRSYFEQSLLLGKTATEQIMPQLKAKLAEKLGGGATPSQSQTSQLSDTKRD